MGKTRRTLRDTLSHYLQSIGATLRFGTVRTYRRAVGDLVAYLDTRYPKLKSFKGLRREPHIEGWLVHTASRPLKTSYRRLLIMQVRRFLDDLGDFRWPEAPPPGLLTRDDLPPPERYLPRPLTWEDDRAVQEELQARPGLLAKGLLLLRRTGMRVGELLDLERDCLDPVPDGGWALRVPLGKLHSERVIPVDPETALLVQEILALRGNPPPSPDPRTGECKHFLLALENGRPPSYGYAYQTLVQAGRSAGCKERVSPHRFRHSYATELLRGGIALPALMRLLGHRTITMTLRYAQVTQADVRRAYFQARERSKDRYELPEPEPSEDQATPRTLEYVMSSFKRLRTLMESFRRENGTNEVKVKARRVIQRIQRAARAFRTLYQ